LEISLISKAKLATAGAFLAFGLFTGGAAIAQDAATEAADEVSEAAQAPEEDEGFDDWGLLGLLGLAGLAGLRKREPEVRTVERREDRVVNTVGDGTRVTRTNDIDPR
jgi:MYXO-CTERM domain-containing protein